MHLVLAGRSDPGLPITSYRANNQVSEVRLFDLRFTSDETLAYLQTVLVPIELLLLSLPGAYITRA